MMPATPIVHIESRPFWRDYVNALIQTQSELRLVAAVDTFAAACQWRDATGPLVILSDCPLLDCDGMTLLTATRKWDRPSAQVVFLTEADDDVTLHRLEREGAKGLLWKMGNVDGHLLPALSAAAAGRRYFPPDVTQRLAKLRSSTNAYFKILSLFEQQLISQACAGMSYRQIAEDARVCEGTVRVHFHRIMGKVGANSRVELMCWGQRVGLAVNFIRTAG